MKRLGMYNNPEIIQENKDLMMTVVKCPYCGHPTTVGQLVGISGYHGCPHCYFVEGGLREIVMYLQKNDYPSMQKDYSIRMVLKKIRKPIYHYYKKEEFYE